ncbi:hypothetical protein KCP74_12125 [Salmonella enterica subsp. enterica]|nr:hypothetical protein KCP74_12125 [Salmonella enterica subsp. enterica]
MLFDLTCRIKRGRAEVCGRFSGCPRLFPKTGGARRPQPVILNVAPPAVNLSARRNYLNRNAPANVLPNGAPAALSCCPDKHALFSLRCGVYRKSEVFPVPALATREYFLALAL